MTAAAYSILFGRRRPAGVDETPEPSCFGDLHLDQVVCRLAGAEDPYRLTGLYRAIVTDPEILRLRQDLFDDLRAPGVRDALDRFSDAMEVVHRRLRAAGDLRAMAQADRWHLNAAAAYCDALRDLRPVLTAESRCEALATIGAHLGSLLDSTAFATFEASVRDIEADLDVIHYSVFLEGARVTVGAYDDEPDHGARVVELFSRFRQDRRTGEATYREDERGRRLNESGSDPVRERIVALVADLHPEVFGRMAEFRRRHPDLLDATVSLFHRELQLYRRYDDLMRSLSDAGLPTTRATLRQEPGLKAYGVYDLALASRDDAQARAVVGNDVELGPGERRVVITGPNQGGKTTLSRTIGQLHHLAALGFPVPGTRVELQPTNGVLTHFERQELGHAAGKLEDDLHRIRAVLTEATATSVVVLNEIFASTTTADAVELATRVLRRLQESGALCVCVTFLDEIAHLPDTVTLVAQVEPGDVSRRTFRVVRAAADGRAFATALARKHRLTHDEVEERVCAST